jgi:hypothetical protein
MHRACLINAIVAKRSSSPWWWPPRWAQTGTYLAPPLAIGEVGSAPGCPSLGAFFSLFCLFPFSSSSTPTLPAIIFFVLAQQARSGPGPRGQFGTCTTVPLPLSLASRVQKGSRLTPLPFHSCLISRPAVALCGFIKSRQPIRSSSLHIKQGSAIRLLCCLCCGLQTAVLCCFAAPPHSSSTLGTNTFPPSSRSRSTLGIDKDPHPLFGTSSTDRAQIIYSPIPKY